MQKALLSCGAAAAVGRLIKDGDQDLSHTRRGSNLSSSVSYPSLLEESAKAGVPGADTFLNDVQQTDWKSGEDQRHLTKKNEENVEAEENKLDEARAKINEAENTLVKAKGDLEVRQRVLDEIKKRRARMLSKGKSRSRIDLLTRSGIRLIKRKMT